LPDWDTFIWLAAVALVFFRGRLRDYEPAIPAGSCTPANARMVLASDFHDALEVRRPGLLVVINSNCHALHGVRAEIAALKQVVDAEPPEARPHLAGHAGLFEKHRAMIEALVSESEGLRSELKQWCISSGLQALSPLEASCQAFIQQSRMACDNALYVTRTLGTELARSRARPH